MVELDVGLERKDAGAGEPAFRCGLSLRGSEGPVRDAVVGAAIFAANREAALIAVAWARDVAWRKRIRLSKR
jgi:hypothetical protein